MIPILLLFLITLKVLATANTIGFFFLDEIGITHAAINFYKKFDYTTHFFLNGGGPFGPYVSVGFLSSWLGGLTFHLGANLYECRVIITLYIFFLLAILCWYFLKKIKKQNQFLLAYSVLLALICQMPFWFHFMINLGELMGAIFFAAGILLFVYQRFHFGAFFLGMAVWHGKFLYLPASVFFLMWVISDRRKFFTLISFFIPLVLWMFVIALKYDVTIASKWFLTLLDYVRFGGSGLAEKPLSFYERFRVQEWGRLTTGTQGKIIFFTMGMAFLVFLKAEFKKNRFKNIETPLLLSLLFYVGWYFFISRDMLARHILPGCYLGLGYFYFRIQKKPILYLLACSFILFEITNTLGSSGYLKKISEESTYAQSCRGDILSKQCYPK